MSTDIEICAQALIRLGETPITSFDDGTDAAEICATIYPQYARFLISKHPWKFARKKVQLARLSEAPVNEYQYQFQLPSSLLQVRAVYNSGSVGARPVQDYRRLGNQIHSNHPELWLEFQFFPAEEDWPFWFREFAITALAGVLAMPVTEKEAKAQLWQQVAFGLPSDNQQGGMFADCKRTDAQESPQEVVVDNPVLAARFS
jgi:hypothetical protein